MTAIIPVFNGASFIEASVRSVLGQTMADLECIVVDDGSTDATPEVVQAIVDPRLRYVRQDNGGVSNARNTGLDAARGRYVAFLDADDVWLPLKLERQVAVLRQRPSLGLVITGYTIVDETLKRRVTIVPDSRQLDLRKLLMLEASGIGLSFTGMVPIDIARQVRFDESLSTGADLEFALGVRERWDVDAVHESLVQYRVHANQMHLDLEAFERDCLRIYGRWFAPGMPLAGDRARAMGNLYTRLCFYELSRRRFGPAARAAALAARHAPTRLVGLPLWFVATRIRRRALTILHG